MIVNRIDTDSITFRYFFAAYNIVFFVDSKEHEHNGEWGTMANVDCRNLATVYNTASLLEKVYNIPVSEALEIAKKIDGMVKLVAIAPVARKHIENERLLDALLEGEYSGIISISKVVNR